MIIIVPAQPQIHILNYSQSNNEINQHTSTLFKYYLDNDTIPTKPHTPPILGKYLHIFVFLFLSTTRTYPYSYQFLFTGSTGEEMDEGAGYPLPT